jgi:hypothetical protein
MPPVSTANSFVHVHLGYSPTTPTCSRMGKFIIAGTVKSVKSIPYIPVSGYYVNCASTYNAYSVNP